MNEPFLETISTRPRVSKRVWIGLVSALVILAAVVGIVWRATRPDLPYAMGDYRRAAEDGDDGRVLDIYDALRQRRADLEQDGDRHRALVSEATEIIDAIESETAERGTALILSTADGRTLNTDELAWLDRFAAMAGTSFHRAIEQIFERYLERDLDRASLQNAVRNLSAVPTFARTYGTLFEQIDLLDGLREQLEPIDAAAEAGRHDAVALALEDLLEADAHRGAAPIEGYLERRMAAARDLFYKEQMPILRDLMAHRKTYSAFARMELLARWRPDDEEVQTLYARCLEHHPGDVTVHWDPVEHLAIKPIIADAARAFDGDRFARSADLDLLLIDEFEAILGKLYENDYVLVDPHAFLNDDGTLAGVSCPRGKKPLVLVLEDFYASFPRAESGIAMALDCDDDGRIVGCLLDEDGTWRSDRSFSAIGIVETFIEAHPDFSFDGATGAIAIVGQNGLFGHPVADVQDLALRREAEQYDLTVPPSYVTDFEENRAKVERIVSALRANNWRIADGTYGRLHLAEASLDDIRQDISLSERFVEPWTGPLDTLYGPFGQHITYDAAKMNLWIEAGRTLHSGHDVRAYSVAGDRYVYTARTFCSGYGLRRPGEFNLNRFFNAAEVIDRTARP